MSSLEGEGAGGEDTSHPWIGRNFAVKLEREEGCHGLQVNRLIRSKRIQHKDYQGSGIRKDM